MKKEIIQYLMNASPEQIRTQMRGLSLWLSIGLYHLDEQGNFVAEFVVREDMLNGLGTLHGGTIGALLDEVMGLQLFLQTPDDVAYTATTLYVDFLEKAELGDVIYAYPKIMRIGRNTANVECHLKSKEGKLLSKSSSNYLKLK